MTEATATSAAWRALLEQLASAEALLSDPSRGSFDAADHVAHFRHLTHLTSYAFDLCIESDPNHPAFVPLAAPTKKILGDNTDSVYHYTNISGRGRYRITGRRADECYLSFIVHGGPDRATTSSQRTIDNLNMQAMQVGDDGSFEITVSAEEAPGNWLRLEDDATCIITREYYFDRRVDRPATFSIERLDDLRAPPAFDDAGFAARLAACSRFVTDVLRMVPMRSTAATNAFDPPFRFLVTMPSWGTPDNVYCRASFDLAPDEALVVRGHVVPAAYWGVQLWNRFMQSLDYRYHRASLNTRTAVLGPDGSFEIVIAALDPGVANWIDTSGHRLGEVFVRWLCPEGEPTRPDAEVVPVASLAGR